mmetsp:Transcript_18419/g.58141  ORF Transcript_18419/g.58141 Transcript_18419/m.58141 type:complete len:618 (+) Transcript_18419:1-1854(+)
MAASQHIIIALLMAFAIITVVQVLRVTNSGMGDNRVSERDVTSVSRRAALMKRRGAWAEGSSSLLRDVAQAAVDAALAGDDDGLAPPVQPGKAYATPYVGGGGAQGRAGGSSTPTASSAASAPARDHSTDSAPGTQGEAAGSLPPIKLTFAPEGEEAQHAAVPPDADCPSRKPFHTILTAQTSTYQQWQSRIMYYHWLKQRRAAGPCTDMTRFTRLAASKSGKADGLERVMPTIYIAQLADEVIASHMHFGVLNRPYSFKVLLQTPELRAKIAEEYVFIMETDHVLLRPLPNLATPDLAYAFDFGYMHAGRHVDWVVKRYWPEGSYADVQPVGPSPVLIHVPKLELIVDDWLDFSMGLRSNAEAESVIQGWVQEMWGYSIAAAKHGVKHNADRNAQIEGSAMTRSIRGVGPGDDFTQKYYIYHYTYGSEYRMDGQPQGVNQIGEWSLDKRHYGGAYPPKDLELPPNRENPLPLWLTRAWNEAMAADDNWPETKALGTRGWRRECAAREAIRAHPVASRLPGSEWTWAGIRKLQFTEHPCTARTPWGEAKYGLLSEGGRCDAACAQSTIFLDFSGGLHNLQFKTDASGNLVEFTSTRVGDEEKVRGVRLIDDAPVVPL